MTRAERYRRIAAASWRLAYLIPAALITSIAIWAWRTATGANRRERLATSRAAVAHAIALAERHAPAYAAVDRLYTAVHIPAQRRAS